MKRLMVPLVVLAFLGGLASPLRAQSPCCEGQECPAKADARYTKELLDLLQTTHSVDAFIVTLNLLVDTDVEPRTAIPLIVRHAERIGVLGDSLQQDKEDVDQPSYLVIEVIGTLRERMHGAHPAAGAATGSAAAAPCTPAKCAERCLDSSKTAARSDARANVLPPIREGSADACNDEPDDAEVLRALGKPQCVSCVEERCREDVHIVKERVVDRVDEVRFYPMIGQAQLHHCHWKCTVYYKDKLEGSYPFPYQVTQPRVEVVYIDKDHLHLCPPEEKVPQCQLFDSGRGAPYSW
jgi:hypothetical protein